MSFRDKLLEVTQNRDSLLCVGLDTDPGKIPEKLLHEEDAVFSFNKEIIDYTCDFAAAYKINTAFYEALGEKGWLSLEKTISYIHWLLDCVQNCAYFLRFLRIFVDFSILSRRPLKPIPT